MWVSSSPFHVYFLEVTLVMVAKVLYLSLISPEVVQVCISTSFIQVAALDQNDIVVQ